ILDASAISARGGKACLGLSKRRVVLVLVSDRDGEGDHPTEPITPVGVDEAPTRDLEVGKVVEPGQADAFLVAGDGRILGRKLRAHLEGQGLEVVERSRKAGRRRGIWNTDRRVFGITQKRGQRGGGALYRESLRVDAVDEAGAFDLGPQHVGLGNLAD